jgi:hypothetical protein
MRSVTVLCDMRQPISVTSRQLLLAVARTISVYAAPCWSRNHPNVRDPAVASQNRCRTYPIAVRSVTKEPCGRSRFFCRRRRLAPVRPFRYRSRRLKVILREAARATTVHQQDPRDSRSCMGTFASERQNGIKLTCCAAVPTLQAQREPVAGLADQQISRFKSIERLN